MNVPLNPPSRSWQLAHERRRRPAPVHLLSRERRGRDRRGFLLPFAGATAPGGAAAAPPRAMRRPDSAPVGESPQGGAALPPLGAIVWTRLAFGPRPGDVAAFQALGGNDTARLTAWVDQQLAPASIPDTACAARIAASGFTTLNKTLAQLFHDHHVLDPDWWERIRPAIETELAAWTRAVHSERQLFEVLVDFWHDHFNVYGWEFVEAPVWVHYDRDVVRANALGNFRTMLEAVAKSPAMLVYLDNFLNFAGEIDGEPVGSNENYARELIELHCMGAVSSYGPVPRETVPGYPNPEGYCQEDVVDVARALTGWTFAIDWIEWPCSEGGDNDGHFFYCESSHDTLPKEVLGTPFPGGRTAAVDGAAVFDRLASHPATGRFVARKLCRRLIGDFPPQAVVDSAAALFTAQWQAPDQLKQVVRHIVLSTEFRTTFGEKVKRPFEIAASALRAAGGDFPFTVLPADEDDVNGFHWMFEAGGQPLFGWHPPNGYPDVRAAWQSANPRVALWRLVNWLVEGDANDDDPFLDIVAATVASPARSANEIVDFWIQRVFGRTIDAGERAELVDMMAAGHNPDFDLPIEENDWPDYTKDRLRSLVGLLFMSPEFLKR